MSYIFLLHETFQTCISELRKWSYWMCFHSCNEAVASMLPRRKVCVFNIYVTNFLCSLRLWPYITSATKQGNTTKVFGQLTLTQLLMNCSEMLLWWFIMALSVEFIGRFPCFSCTISVIYVTTESDLTTRKRQSSKRGSTLTWTARAQSDIFL